MSGFSHAMPSRSSVLVLLHFSFEVNQIEMFCSKNKFSLLSTTRFKSVLAGDGCDEAASASLSSSEDRSGDMDKYELWSASKEAHDRSNTFCGSQHGKIEWNERDIVGKEVS